MIRVEALEKKFGKLNVLKGISAEFGKGEVVSVIGPNGSGKTTLIKCILGMVIADKGQLYFDNHLIKGDFTYRERIGYMPQIGRYPDNMKIGHLFDMMKDIRHTNGNKTDEDLIQDWQLHNMNAKAMRTLSGGTRQKVSAALAFMFNPDVLILDEPTAGLDPVSSEILKSKILKAKELGKLIIITSHIMSEVEELADKVLYIFEGNIRFYKTVEALKSETDEERLGRAVAKIMNNTSYN